MTDGTSATVSTAPQRKVGALLGIGIFLLPIVFVWFLLRGGYSSLARVIGFGWLVVSGIMGVAMMGGSTAPPQPGSAPAVASSPFKMPMKKVDKAKYDQVKSGMSYSQVVAIIGDPGEENSRSDVAGFTTVLYSWSNYDGSSMNAMFQNDKLVNKAQFGLD